MTTTLELVEDTRRHLYAGQSEELNRLNGSLTLGATSIPLKYALNGIQPGSIIAIDLEEIQVWETSGTNITVAERGVNGSTAAAHDDLDTVFVRPKFTSFRILRAINNDLKDLSSPYNGLYQVKVATATYSPAIAGYNIPSAVDVLSIIEITYDEVGPGKTFPKIGMYALRRDMATTDFASGFGLILYDPAFPGRNVRIKYRAPYSALATMADNVTTVAGLQESAMDLPPLGAALRLVAPRDVKRSFSESQGEPRRAEEVPVGGSSQAMRGLLGVRQSRILAEAARLEAAYPKVLIV